MIDDLTKLIGKRIRELRKNANFTQDEFSELLNIDSKHLSRIECAKVQPSLNLIKKITEILNIEIDYFFKINHLNSKEFLIKSINKTLMGMPDEKIRLFYKILESIKN